MATTAYIISKNRQRHFDSPPDLSISRNSGYIAIDAQTIQIIKSMQPVNKVGYVLQKAYFHAKGRFFNLKQFPSKHVRLVEACLGIKRKIGIHDYPYSTMKAHQEKILIQFGWEKSSPSHIESLAFHAETLAETNPLKEDILFKLVERCWETKVIIPNYSKLATIVNNACTNYEARLEQDVENALSMEQKNALLAIFNQEILSNDFAKLCKIHQSRNQQQLVKNAQYLEIFKQWHDVCSEPYKRLDLPISAIEYYAGIVKISTKTQLKRISNSSKKALLALCFIVHNYRNRVDYSIDAFIKDIRSEKTNSMKFDREANARSRERIASEEELFISSFESSTQTIRLILNVAQNHNISLAERNEKTIQLALACLTGDTEAALESLAEVRIELENTKTKKHRFSYLFGQGMSLSRKYNIYLNIWEFDSIKSDKKILQAIRIFLLRNAPKTFLMKMKKTFFCKMLSFHLLPSTEFYFFAGWKKRFATKVFCSYIPTVTETRNLYSSLTKSGLRKWKIYAVVQV